MLSAVFNAYTYLLMSNSVWLNLVTIICNIVAIFDERRGMDGVIDNYRASRFGRKGGRLRLSFWGER